MNELQNLPIFPHSYPLCTTSISEIPPRPLFRFLQLLYNDGEQSKKIWEEGAYESLRCLLVGCVLGTTNNCLVFFLSEQVFSNNTAPSSGMQRARFSMERNGSRFAER